MPFKDTFFSKNRNLNCGGKMLDLTIPRIMGILNVTPDSFFNGGRYETEDKIRIQIKRMVDEKADIIDIGGISTRPGAKPVSEEEELNRIIPALKLIRKEFPGTIISVDTWRSAVARYVMKEFNVEIINDISGGQMDNQMFKTIADSGAVYIVMHMRGTPETMQSLTVYDDILKEILDYFARKVSRLTNLGVNDIIIDPGFGFSKTVDQNFCLLHHLEDFHIFEMPVMVGFSRKSMIYRTLQTESSEALNGTTVLNTIALMKGADILRVHDVKEAFQAITLVDKVLHPNH